MRRRVYNLSSAYTPEELHVLLDEKAAWENRKLPEGEHRERKVKLHWRNAQTFELQVGFYSYSDETFQDVGPAHISVGKGMRISLSEIFCGTIQPNNLGGSLLEGKFFLSRLSFWLLVSTVLILGCIVHAATPGIFHTVKWLEALSFVASFSLLKTWTKELYRAHWNSETSPVNQAVLRMLEDWIKDSR